MTETEKSARETEPPPSDQDDIAEEYLNLWQQNLKKWAADPHALEKWLKEIKRKEKT